MKGRTGIVFVIALLCCMEAQAQVKFNKPLKSSSQSQLGVSNYNFGVKLGCPWSYMDKTDLSETSIDGNFGYLIGILGERNLGKWSVALEATFAQRGTKMHNQKEYQISLSEDGIVRTVYSLAYDVVSVRIPVTYYFKGMIKDDKVIPYLFVGPEVDLPLPFNFDLMGLKKEEVRAILQRFDGPNGESLYQNSVIPFSPVLNVSAVAGMGIMSKIRTENSAIYIKLDAAYNRGLLNMAVPTKEAWKWPFDKDQGVMIFAHDVEVNLTVIFPIKKNLHDACYLLK